jgi:glycerol-1-phosphate dehydrogenase [NAD(P)+]
VAIGTLAVALLYGELLALPLERLDVDAAVARWRTEDEEEAMIAELLGEGELAEKARLEMSAKRVTPSEVRRRLGRLREAWPSLRERLRRHLPTASKLAEMLAAVGAPTRPEEIGISRARLRLSFRQAYLIRRRFTVLDLAAYAGVLETCVDRIFAPGGVWPNG